MEKILPDILNGYCEKSPQPREIAEQEAKEFLQIISDASSYMFGYNHSVGYCMIGYLCAYLRYYHPYEFITAYLNNANGEEDVKNGNELATLYGIKIVPPRFGFSKDKYLLNKEEKVIAKGISSVKYMNADVANELYELAEAGKPKSFMELLQLMNERTHLDTRQRDILVKIDYGTTVAFEDIKDWDMTLAFPTLTKQQIFGVLHDDELWKSLEPMPGSQRVLQKWFDQGHQLYMVTASDYRTCKVKVERILEMFPFLDWEHIIFASNKQMIRGDILIDDGIHNLLNGEYFKILFNRPHNRGLDVEKYGVQRADTWDDVDSMVQEFAEREDLNGCN